ncbi:hypothetical protein DQW50_05930 [Halorubrum sp. 48-1-W]|uniref:DUF7538 family protein n=1 Tax=Halorubrum sp. 48-1-W TaxID=2249761 RepID=UPI000DCEDDBD|nr:hypothetical protein [Halorubrum sp. 48-1-W]RAW46008.1 hypothetical protein DQW50_05930 [Halorubrum sp. 48-1-W]
MYDSIAALVRQEGWRAEGAAARVHYDGGGDRFAVEFYADADRVLYWTVPDAATEGDDTAAPVPRGSVPDPLRRRIRADLDTAGVDPGVERRSV